MTINIKLHHNFFIYKKQLKIKKQNTQKDIIT